MTPGSRARDQSFIAGKKGFGGTEIISIGTVDLYTEILAQNP